MKAFKALVLAAALASTAGLAQAQEYPKTDLKVVGTWSNLSQYKNYEVPFWTETLKEKSNGAITADIKGFNEMGLKGGEIGRLMKQGVIDIGATVLGYMAPDDPRNEAVDLAGLGPDVETARKVTEAYRPELDKLYKEKYDVKVLGLWPYSAQVIYCKAPIQQLSDLKGKKVRTGTRSLAEFVEAFGGTGVTLPFSEVVQAMQTGVVDCAVTGAMSGYSAKWYEVSDYLYTLPVGWSQVMLGVSNSRWNKLDPKVRELLQTEIKALENRLWDAAEAESEMGFACNTGKGECKAGPAADMTLVEFKPEDQKLLNETLENVVLRKWGERCGKECSAGFNETIGKVVPVKVPL